jgi:glycosyltransferase involved in cell wall biosynthesis
MNAQGQTVCLNMIVKNEAPVIRRCLDSVRPLIDHWVIVDTGSTDGTQEIIRDHMKDVPGELFERPWRNFAHNRTEALDLARGRSDYIFVIDADEQAEVPPGWQMPALTADSYLCTVHYGATAYARKQLVRSALPWRYESVVHEYITCDVPATEATLPGYHTLVSHDGARSRDPNTYRRDAIVLEQALLEEPENHRYMFYLAQSYRDAGDDELAIRYYRKRIEMGGWTEEVWVAKYQIARAQERMGAPWPEAMESYLAAWQYQPVRAEPLYNIGMHYQVRAQHQTSHIFLSRAMQVPSPGIERLFVERAVYDYLLPLEYAVALFYLGHHDEAIEINERLLASDLLPDHLRDLVERNRGFSRDALGCR